MGQNMTRWQTWVGLTSFTKDGKLALLPASFVDVCLRHFDSEMDDDTGVRRGRKMKAAGKRELLVTSTGTGVTLLNICLVSA